MRQSIKTEWIWVKGIQEFLALFFATFLLSLKSFPNKNSNKKGCLGYPTYTVKACISLFTHLSTSPSSPAIGQGLPRWYFNAPVVSGLWRQLMTPESLSSTLGYTGEREAGAQSWGKTSLLHCPLPYLSTQFLGQALSWGPSLGGLHQQAWPGPQAAGALSSHQGMLGYIHEKPMTTEDTCELTNHISLGWNPDLSRPVSPQL